MQPESLAHYRILRPLGSGGMGEVFLAEDTRLHRKVALKLLRPDQADGEAGRKRLMREAQAAAQLDHPNACSIYEVGESELGAYIAMQFIEGENLADLMVNQRLELGRLLDIGIQVADALAEAHAQGLVHRDIKPHNIMVTSKGQAKVLDFGLAKRIETIAPGDTRTLLTNPGMVLGTVPYMSPEQVKGEELDGRSDVFSLGAVLFEVATGKRPFEAKSGAELMAMILTFDPFDVTDPALPLNPELRRILQRALAKELPKRYQGARELRDDLIRLRTLVSGATVMGIGFGDDATTLNRPRLAGLPDSTARRHLRRRRGWALGLGAAALAGAALAAFIWLKPHLAIDSIAVLPIANESGDAGIDYVSDGLTENLIQQLSHLQGLKVIARSSILRYKGQNADPATVGRELGVRTVLVGRMRTQGSQLQLNLELADAKEQNRLWGAQLMRPATDLVALQDSIAHELTQHLGRGTPTADLKALEQGRVKTSSTEAYDLYLRGRYYADKMSPGDFAKAVAFFDQALKLDPGFALAYSGKATAYWSLSSLFRPSGEVMPLVKSNADKALSLDPSIADAYSARGSALRSLDLDRAGAEADYRKAVALEPNQAQTHQFLAYFLLFEDRQEESRAESKRAIELDPLSSLSHASLGYSYYIEGKWAQAEAALARAGEIDPDNTLVAFLRAMVLEFLGKPAKAKPLWEAALKSGSPYAEGYAGFREARFGDRAKALAIARSLEARLKPGEPLYVSPYFPAMVYAGLRDWERAYALVERAIRERDEMAISLRVDPFWKEVRAEPKFKELVLKSGG